MTNFTSPAKQQMNLIRYIGDRVSESGKPIDQIGAKSICSIIGAPSEEFLDHLIEELADNGIIKMIEPIRTIGGNTFLRVNLTLTGWKLYEAEKRGQLDGNIGFMAMQFGVSDLDSFVENVVKPAVKRVGYRLVTMKDVSTAGVIDNIMSVQIRDATFVIADLTHDNNGAYWEAGYAEGLGKPVIYICEKDKFEKTRTHFDTNHRTTIKWSKDDPEQFSKELIATLRRSLSDRTVGLRV